VVCRLKTDDDPIGYAGGSLDRYCADVVPVAGDTEFQYTRTAREMLVMTLIPTRAGTTRVSDVTIDYATDRSHLWRRGSQTLAATVSIRAR
jgi:hypothetical protein